MTRLTLVAAALIAAAATQAQAASMRHAVSSRAAVTQTATDACVRAPAEGSYASAPYTQPPCLPNTGYSYAY
ncbi:hypothetical protein FBZ96_103434 [Bradyrhizobium stylosanthis]|uniref:Porin n=1 Tax=Bradyrhizobium stylosanthis TaxID=1803665 RepID=A0A560DX13_9BRAD|nr:hypothetical protein FBZ96_103434 [Bradyrhizobium stylosanthis]